MIGIAVLFAIGAFLYACAEVVGFGGGEKMGLALILVGGLVMAVIGFQLASDTLPSDFKNWEDWNQESQRLDRQLVVSRIATSVFGVGMATLFTSAGRRTWTHRRQLFPFLYQESVGEADEENPHRTSEG